MSVANYLCLTILQIIGAPSFFPTVWNWIKRWFDPVTVSKIFILSASEVKPTLETFMEPESIPSQYGGTLDFKWGDMPKLDEPARKLAGAIERPEQEGGYLKGPMRFRGDHIEVLGSDQGQPRRQTIPVPVTASTETTETETETEEPAPVQDPSEKVEELAAGAVESGATVA